MCISVTVAIKKERDTNKTHHLGSPPFKQHDKVNAGQMTTSMLSRGKGGGGPRFVFIPRWLNRKINHYVRTHVVQDMRLRLLSRAPVCISISHIDTPSIELPRSVYVYACSTRRELINSVINNKTTPTGRQLKAVFHFDLCPQRQFSQTACKT